MAESFGLAALARPGDTGWIDVPVCEAVLTDKLNILVAIDGCAESMAGLDYVADFMLQRDREAMAEVFHIYDDSKVNLPPSFRKDFLRTHAETKLASSVSSKRFRLTWRRKTDVCSSMINEQIVDTNPAFVCMGYSGRKGRKKDGMLASNVFEVLRSGKCSAIVIKDASIDDLPVRRHAKFVVSVSLNTASTKAFLDALRLSKPGDEIHVVYVKGYMEGEGEDSEYTVRLREKYRNFFGGLQDGEQHVFNKFHDRNVEFQLIPKLRAENTPQAIVRYADSIDADFLIVGYNAIEKSKSPLGSISMQICLEWDRNVVVSSWVDVNPRIYEAHVRVATPLNQGRRATT